MNEGDAGDVLQIYAEGMATGHATFEQAIPSWNEWSRSRLPKPRLVAEDEGGVAGFAALSPASSRPVYRGVAEVSLYVAERARGCGWGRRLLEALVEAASGEGLWTLQAGIFPENRASLAIHAACGFKVVGRRERIGRMGHGPMAGRWRDVVWMARRGEDTVVSAYDGVDALFFDVFGTLVDWRGSIAREVEAMLPGVDGDMFARAWRGRYQPAMERVRSGGRGFVRLDVLHKENLLETLEQFEVESLDNEKINHLNRVWHRLDAWPDTVEGLQRLKNRFIIAPCSNGNIALMTNLAKRNGMPFDVILGAEPTQSYKPMPQTYLGSAGLLDLPPGRCMMVAAHNSDLAAARECGLKTAFFPRADEHGAEAGLDLEAGEAWTFTAGDLVDLASQMGC
ncbi:MAG: haloacid dehalogenase type II [Geminicoccaceae bacterium]